MQQYGITSRRAATMFLAQVAHESALFRATTEYASGAAYEGRRDLGNTQPGDGRRFSGRGLIQTTGRDNYRATRDGLRKFVQSAPDFEADPARLEEPQWAALSAAWYWPSRGLNALADAGDFRRITVRINGGTNGMADRLALWAKAKDVLGVAA